MPEKERKVQLPTMQTRAEFQPSSLNEQEKTVELIWSVGAKGLRSTFDDDSYYEELSMDPKCVRMQRLQSGSSPLLDNHSRWSGSNAVIGVVDSARIENGIGTAKVRFADTADVADIWRKVQTGIIKNVSVGYSVYRYERQPMDESDSIPTYLATDWEPTEISLVPIGFDQDARIRSKDETSVSCVFVNNIPTQGREKEREMPENEKLEQERKAAAEKAAAEKTAAAEQARAAEKARQAQIRELTEKVGLDAEFATRMIDSDKSVDEARAAAIDALAEKNKKNVGQIRGGVTVTGGAPAAQQERRLGIENAIMHRAGSVKELSEQGRQFRGMSLIRMAEDCLVAEGVNVRGMSPMELATRAMSSTGDFPAILANVLNKSLRKAYDEAPKTFEPIVRVTEVADFKQISRTQLSNAPTLDLVGENGEIKRGKFTDAAESYAVQTYAKTVAVTRKAIINDDLSAFSRIPEAFGRSAASLESDLVWGLIIANAAMGDSVALFHASHSNLEATTKTAPSIASLNSMRAALRLQKGLDKARLLNLIPKFLIGPAALEASILQVCSTDLIANQLSNINTFKGLLTPIIEPRLDGNSQTAWYASCDPAQNDVIEMAYLTGQRGVYTETRQGWEVEGIEVKARLDVGAKVIDWRSMFKNPGV